MKCANCGAELKVGCIYCSVCGKEAQIVSDYNLLEDDFLRDVLKEKKKKNPNLKKPLQKQNTKKSTQKSSADHAGKNTKAARRIKKHLIFAFVAIALLVILVTAIILTVNHTRKNSYDYQMEQAENYYSDMNYREAEHFVKRALELDADSLEAKIMLADIYMLRGEKGKAAELLEEVCKTHPDSAEAYKKLIQVYGDKKDYESIQRLAEDVDDIEILELFSDYLPEMPEFSVAEGTYQESVTIEISAGKPDSIFYTTDGSDPKTGTKYLNPILVEPGEEVHIRAVSRSRYGVYSEEAEGDFKVEIPHPDSPQVTPSGGTFYSPQAISVTVPEGCSVYYTWDDTEPTNQSNLYTQPIEIPEGNNILSLVAVNEYGMSSHVLKRNYIRWE